MVFFLPYSHYIFFALSLSLYNISLLFTRFSSLARTFIVIKLLLHCKLFNQLLPWALELLTLSLKLQSHSLSLGFLRSIEWPEVKNHFETTADAATFSLINSPFIFSSYVWQLISCWPSFNQPIHWVDKFYFVSLQLFLCNYSRCFFFSLQTLQGFNLQKRFSLRETGRWKSSTQSFATSIQFFRPSHAWVVPIDTRYKFNVKW